MVFFNQLDPILVYLGPLAIRWYGVMYVLAFLVIYFYGRSRIAQKKTDITVEQLDTLLFRLTIALIVGARIFNIFWDPSYYLSHPLKIIAVWEGGLSFHGGLLAMLFVTWHFCKKTGQSLLKVADLFIVPLSLGQAFGRLGNFFNSELYGTATTLSWGVNFNNEVDTMGQFVFRHPNQLYELGYDLVIFAVLYSLRNRSLRGGTLFAIFLVLYAVFRFFTEFLRVGEPLYFGFTLGQLFNVVMLLGGLYLLKKKE